MAMTKRARYLFKVSEYSPEVREGKQPGTLRIVPVPGIVAEHSRECEGFESPLDNGGFIFDLRDGTSMDEASKIADFLNQNLLSIGTVTFGDAEDIAREVDNSERNLANVKEGLTDAVVALEANLAAGKLEAAIESLKAVKGWAWQLSRSWAQTIERWR